MGLLLDILFLSCHEDPGADHKGVDDGKGQLTALVLGLGIFWVG